MDSLRSPSPSNSRPAQPNPSGSHRLTVKGFLLIALVVSTFIEAENLVATVSWRRALELVTSDPEQGAETLSSARLLALPSALTNAGAFPDRNLARAGRDAVVRALRRLGRFQVRWYPTDPAGWLNLTRASMVEQKRQHAAESLDRAVALAPTSAFIHRIAAVHARFLGDRDREIYHLVESEAIGTGERLPVTSLSTSERELVGLQAQERRIELYPLQYVRFRLALAETHRRRGDRQRAVFLLVDAEPHDEFDLALARWALEDGALDEAIDRALPIARRSVLPTQLRVQAWFIVAQVREQQGDESGALEAAQETTRLDPRSPHPYLIFADLAEQRGDAEGALSHIRHAWGISPTNTRVLLRLARLTEQVGAYQDAGLALRRASEIAPDNPHIALERIRFYIRRGNFREASVLLARATERFPDDGRFLSLLGQSWVGIRYRDAVADR
ncbi:MAG: tetratricopeptide repeat protein [bacterium]|nr:tetratricopeptide repeat protein [bacterium]